MLHLSLDHIIKFGNMVLKFIIGIVSRTITLPFVYLTHKPVPGSSSEVFTVKNWFPVFFRFQSL